MEPLDWIGEHLDSSKLMSRPSFAESLQLQTQAAAGSCRYEITTVSEIVRKAAGGELDIPAFQRGFVWTEAQLRDLAESLWRDYPIGMLLLWEPQIGDAHRTRLLVADGQHRIISLCALFGQKPHWCAGNGDQSHTQMSIWFDPTAEKSGWFFVGGEPTRSKGARRHLVSVPHLLALSGGEPGVRIYNVGSETGYSVRQVVEMAREVTGRPLEIIERPRRAGDQPATVASSALIRRELGWEPRHSDLRTLLASAWAWRQSHLKGYQG